MTAEIKEEILSEIPIKRCCRRLFLQSWFQFHHANALIFGTVSIARFLITILRSLNVTSWGAGLRKSGHEREGTIVLNESTMRTLFSGGLNPKSTCCQKTYLKSLFLARGSLSVSKHGYHLELHGLDRYTAKAAAKASRNLNCPPQYHLRRQKGVLYYKSGDRIARFLTNIGAVQTLLRFEELRALKETKNKVMRQVNYESANLAKTAKASASMQQKIQSVMKERRWKWLSESVRQTALARISHPSLSLSDLAKKLEISKSALYHRLRRLTK